MQTLQFHPKKWKTQVRQRANTKTTNIQHISTNNAHMCRFPFLSPTPRFRLPTKHSIISIAPCSETTSVPFPQPARKTTTKKEGVGVFFDEKKEQLLKRIVIFRYKHKNQIQRLKKNTFISFFTQLTRFSM